MRYMVIRLFISYPNSSYTIKTGNTLEEANHLASNPTLTPKAQRQLTKRYGAWFDSVQQQPE